MERYLRRRGTDIIHIFTPRLAMREDMVEVDLKFVWNQIKMKKTLIEEAKKQLAAEKITSSEITGELTTLKNLEAEHADLQIAIQKEKEAQEDGGLVTETEPQEVTADPDVILIRDMKTAKEVAGYLSGEHGIEVNAKDYKGDKGLSAIKTMAIDARIKKVNDG